MPVSNEGAEWAGATELDAASVLKQASAWVSPSSVNWHGLSSSKKQRERSWVYGALYGNIVTLPNGSNVAGPV